MGELIRVTPLLGGCEDGGVCCLLEIGGARILLDCGCTLNSTQSEILSVAQLLAAGGGVDCVLLSHADIHHMGALPVMFGANGLQPVPVICTLPVAKFGQMLLYDLCLNIEMEGAVLDDIGEGESTPIGKKNQLFTLDDIDRSLSKLITVRYSQNINFPETGQQHHSGQKQMHFCAYGAGRTLGGAVWRIRHGATEILYMMDINLKKEAVLDGAALDLLPTGPALIIVEGGCASRQTKASTAAQREKKAKGEDTTGVVQQVLDTLRIKGNALIPCESASRLLELLQILGKHWMDNRLVFEHLVLLTPMAHNILEFARSQIEWMTDALSRQFIQAGKFNPFELPPLRLVTSVREMERLYPGPKVVLATDGSLSCGMAKELLLRWGGNPLCRVIMTDSPDEGTLAAELKTKLNSPPIICSVYRPQRIELVGAELAAHQQEQDRKRREREENIQRRKREEELALLSAGRRDDVEEEDDADATSGESANETTSSSSQPDAKRQKTQSSKRSHQIARFAAPSFPMFQTKDTNLVIDEYGASISDLRLLRQGEEPVQPVAARNRAAAQLAAAVAAPGTLAQKAAALKGQQQQHQQDEAELQEVPWKLVSSKIKVQFTCDFKSLSVGGRADLKAVKTAMQKVLPARVVVLRGTAEDCQAVAMCAQSCLPNVETFTPASGTSVSFSVRADRISLYLPPLLLPKAMREIRRTGQETTVGGESACTICAIGGKVAESTDTMKEGTRVLRLQASADTASQASGGSMTVVDGSNPLGSGVVGGEMEGENAGFASLAAAPLELVQPAIGMISVGEVSLNALKTALEKAGLVVEAFSARSSGSVRTYLVCETQVVIRKDNENDFVVEGPPVAAFYQARKIIYKHFAIV